MVYGILKIDILTAVSPHFLEALVKHKQDCFYCLLYLTRRNMQ